MSYNMSNNNIKPILVILAAGMASRYGSPKQVDAFGPQGEKIIDYSIYDAIKAGFGKVVFVIREEFLEVMQANFSQKLAGKVDVAYVFQKADLSTFDISETPIREKPWGTGHAMLSAAQEIDRPFCVINADDFYGYEAFEKMAHFLSTDVSDQHMGMVGFQIGNTLSEFGHVSRGVCEVDQAGHLRSVTERTNIYRSGEGVTSDIVYNENNVEHLLHDDLLVSMNFWGFTPKIIDTAKSLFLRFVESNMDNPKAEFFIPTIPDYMVKNGLASFVVLPTSSKWFGVTYKDDKPAVQHMILNLITMGFYPRNLWSERKAIDPSLYLDA